MSVSTIRRPAPTPAAASNPRLRRRGHGRHDRGSGASWISWMLAAVFVATVFVAGWWVTHSAIFAARDITVTGNHRLSAARILRLAGVSDHTNVLWFSPQAVEATLEQSPWIADATVSRSLPSTLSIAVTELRAEAVLDTGAGRYLVARDGTVLGAATNRSRLPAIAASIRAPAIGSRVASVGPELQVVVQLPDGVRARVATVATEAGHGLVVTLTDGVRVLYGDAADARQKGRAMEAIVDWAAGHGQVLATIDVRLPATPVASPPPPEPSPSASAATNPSPGPSRRAGSLPR